MWVFFNVLKYKPSNVFTALAHNHRHIDNLRLNDCQPKPITLSTYFLDIVNLVALLLSI